MSLAVYNTTIPVFIQYLTNLNTILKKSEDHALTRKIEPSVLLNSRLFPDMFPLIRQVQIASDTAKAAGARLTGQEAPKFEDTETTYDQLYARIQKTIDYLKSLAPESFEGAQARAIAFKVAGRDIQFDGATYITTWVFPNLLFHITTAYNILRHNGVDIGKRDFLGG